MGKCTGLMAAKSSVGNQKGFVVIEALMAMLVFAIGILGLIATQAAMTREQTNAKARIDAANLVTDITGMMWGDIANIANYRSENCNNYPRCKDWISKVVTTMPSASTSVAVDDGTGVVSIVVTWKMPNGDSHQFQTETTIRAVEGV